MMNIHSGDIFGFERTQQNATSVKYMNQFHFLMRVQA